MIYIHFIMGQTSSHTAQNCSEYTPLLPPDKKVKNEKTTWKEYYEKCKSQIPSKDIKYKKL